MAGTRVDPSNSSHTEEIRNYDLAGREPGLGELRLNVIGPLTASAGRIVSDPESAGRNRPFKVMTEPYGTGEQQVHPSLDSCGRHRQLLVEAQIEVTVGRAIELQADG